MVLLSGLHALPWLHGYAFVVYAVGVRVKPTTEFVLEVVSASPWIGEDILVVFGRYMPVVPGYMCISLISFLMRSSWYDERYHFLVGMLFALLLSCELEARDSLELVQAGVVCSLLKAESEV